MPRPTQVPAVRGSPFLRTLLLACGLLLAGLVLWRLVRNPAPVETARHAAPGEPTAVGDRTGFELKLSRPAESVELKGRDGRVLFQSGRNAGPWLGTLALDAVDPTVFVTIRWADAGGGFAKLTLEPPGEPTRVRFFEAPGDLEDVWELPVE
jgi:hypothetical protein